MSKRFAAGVWCFSSGSEKAEAFRQNKDFVKFRVGLVKQRPTADLPLCRLLYALDSWTCRQRYA